MAAMGQPYTRSIDVHVYINGQYWGLYQIEERAENSFGETYIGGDKDDYDVVKVNENSYVDYATDGNMDAWWDLVHNGFRATTYKTNVTVDSLADAEAVLITPEQQLAYATYYHNTLNFRNSGADGRFTGGNVDFPGLGGAATDNFVTEIRGTLLFPQVGTWTIGVSANEGFALYVNGSPTPLMSLDGTRATAVAEVYQTITVTDASSPYEIRILHYDNTGDAEFELFAARGSYATFDPVVFRLVGDVNGAKATTYKAVSGFLVDSLADAAALVTDPTKQQSITFGSASTVNFMNTGTDGHYTSNNAAFPGTTINTEQDNYVVVIDGMVEIPSAGVWTFGVSTDEGFSLQLSRGAYSDSMSLDGTRTAPVDTLKAFNLPEAGSYQVRLVFYDYTGGSELELFRASGDRTATGFNSSQFALATLYGNVVPFSGAGAYYWQIQGLDPVTHERDPDLPVLLDVDNLIDYMLLIFYTGDRDAPISNFLSNVSPNNWYGLRDRSGENGGFQFISHDAEHTLLMGLADRTGPYPAGWDNFFKSTPQMVHQDLMANLEYRLRFADRVRKYLFDGGVLTPTVARDRFLARAIDLGYYDTNAGPVLAESARWGDAKTEPPRNKNNWLTAVNNEINNFFPNRTATLLGAAPQREDVRRRPYDHRVGAALSEHRRPQLQPVRRHGARRTFR